MKKILLGALFALGLASPAWAVLPYTAMGNANYTMLVGDIRIVPTVALSTNRNITLISAASSGIGQAGPQGPQVLANVPQYLEIIDAFGNIGGANSCLVLVPATSETINGSTGNYTFCGTNGAIRLYPVSGSAWIAQPFGPGALPGTTTNDNAQAGYIGEVQQAQLLSLTWLNTSVTPANVAQVGLTAGDWDCRGHTEFVPAGTNTSFTQVATWISTDSAKWPQLVGASENPSLMNLQMSATTSAQFGLVAGVTRFSLAATTSVFLEALSTWTVAPVQVQGTLACRRAR